MQNSLQLCVPTIGCLHTGWAQLMLQRGEYLQKTTNKKATLNNLTSASMPTGFFGLLQLFIPMLSTFLVKGEEQKWRSFFEKVHKQLVTAYHQLFWLCNPSLLFPRSMWHLKAHFTFLSKNLLPSLSSFMKEKYHSGLETILCFNLRVKYARTWVNTLTLATISLKLAITPEIRLCTTLWEYGKENLVDCVIILCKYLSFLSVLIII